MSKAAGFKVGLFRIGLAAYWPQFQGLRERLAGYGTFVGDKMRVMNAEVVDVALGVGPVSDTCQKLACVLGLECVRL
jgi:hypothetical protein